MTSSALDFRGQPAVRLALPDGGSCTVALHGAHVLSWTTVDGVERLYLSPEARFDGQSAIRGGVPVCWPQFNQRGSLPKHGFARNMPWTAEAPEAAGRRDTVVLTLRDSAATRTLWPHAFRARPAASAGAAFGHTRDLAKRELHRDRGLEPGTAALRQARRPARRRLAPDALRRGRAHRRTRAAGARCSVAGLATAHGRLNPS